MICIYAIVNKINGFRYVGSAKDFYNRKSRHLQALRQNKHHSRYMQRAWNKHGESMFAFIILEKVEDRNKLIEREQWWIDNSASQYNVCKVAGNSLGLKRTEETKEKVRQANLGLKHSPERNQIKSLAQGGENHWTKRKGFKEESKIRMSEAQKQLYINGYTHPRARVIQQYTLQGELVREWISATHAAKETIFTRQGINNCIRGLSKQHKNFVWKYK